jgi:flagellar basal body rod protein FlgG
MAYSYQPSAPPMPALPTTIIGPQYCAPYPMDLAIVKKVLTISDGNFAVTDVNGNIVFKVKGSFLTLHDRRVLVDDAGHPITTLRRKVQRYSLSCFMLFFFLL